MYYLQTGLQAQFFSRPFPLGCFRSIKHWSLTWVWPSVLKTKDGGPETVNCVSRLTWNSDRAEKSADATGCLRASTRTVKPRSRLSLLKTNTRHSVESLSCVTERAAVSEQFPWWFSKACQRFGPLLTAVCGSRSRAAGWSGLWWNALLSTPGSWCTPAGRLCHRGPGYLQQDGEIMTRLTKPNSVR